MLLIHAVATLAMAGIIWFVQVVHYPLFPFAANDDFTGFEREHQRRTTWVVAPLMLVEAGTAVLLVPMMSGGPEAPLVWGGLALLAVIWASTFGLQVPRHRQLSDGWKAQAARQLVTTNWVRTIAWTGRAAIAVLLLLPGS